MEAEREGGVDEHAALPPNAQKVTIVRMDRNLPVRLFDIRLSEQGPPPVAQHGLRDLLHGDIADASNYAIVNAVALGTGKFNDEAPLARLVAFWDYPEAAGVKLGHRGQVERAQNVGCRAFAG